MPKFCQSCGNLTDDNAAFCNACGARMTDGYADEPVTVNAQNMPYDYQPQQAPQPQAPPQPAYPQQPAYQQPVYPQQTAYSQQYAPVPQKKRKKVGLIIVVCVLVLALIAAAVLIVVLPLAANIDVFGLHLFGGVNTTTPQECVESFVECLADNDIDGALDCIYETKYSELMRSIFKTQFESQDGSESLKELQAIGKDNVKKMMVITVSDEQPLTNAEASSIKQTLITATVPVEKIEKIERANVHIENKSNGETDDNRFCFALAEGKWYILASASSMDL